VFLNQAVKDAQANLDKTKAQYVQSEKNYVREKTLFDKQLESEANYDVALASLDSDKALVRQAQVALDKAKLNLQLATISAPISGVVINRQVSVGQTVAASFSSPTLFTIANDLTKMQVETIVDESDIGKVTVGQPANFTVDAYADDNFSGAVSQIRLAPQIVQNVVNYTVVISVNNDSLKLMPGMTANVKILVGQEKNVLKVSNLALRFQPPPDLVDSIKLKEMRNILRADSKGSGSAAYQRSNDSTSQIPTGQTGQGMLVNMEKNKFQMMRDSIIKVHGGKMSKDQMASEFNKAYEKIKKSSEQKPPVNVQPRGTKAANNFTIVSRYPQYQKRSDDITDKIIAGRVWILNKDGNLEPVFVKIGLSDGKASEIISNNVKDGEQIVISADSNNGQTTTQQKNPLAGQQQGQGQNRGR
ncbi:MAG: efflux RND transporter periplasmic adaptor subunit, partial [Ignavibacteriaceae bacterium]|nr:efflux RND transporter periplasmic adaptor subunit [Ignavibacteriaceae bacterium]